MSYNLRQQSSYDVETKWQRAKNVALYNYKNAYSAVTRYAKNRTVNLTGVGNGIKICMTQQQMVTMTRMSKRGKNRRWRH